MFPRSGFYLAALLAVAIFAFWPSYFSKLSAATAYMHVHAVLMAAWMALLVAQALLIRGRNNALHRRLGRIAYLLAPAAVLSGILLAHSRFAALEPAAFVASARFLYLPFAGTVLFALTAGLAIRWRRTPPVHARLMIGTALTLIDPVVARILGFRFDPLPNDLFYPLIGYGITDALLLALVLADARDPRGRGVFAIMLVAFGLVHLGFFVWSGTHAWLRFASWFRALPLTG